MHLNHSNIAALVSTFNSSSLENKDVIEFGIASTIARRCVARSEDYLEDMEVVNDEVLTNHYMKKHRNRVAMIVLELNREIPINVDQVNALTEKLFVYMANIFAGCFAKNIICTNPAGAGDIFNMGHYVEKELLERVYENMSVYNRTTMVARMAIDFSSEDEG